MPRIITESEIEQVALDILKELGYQIIHRTDIMLASGGKFIPRSLRACSERNKNIEKIELKHIIIKNNDNIKID